MEITYLGHSCFRIRGRDSTVVTDPFSPKYGYAMGKPQAGIVTVSSVDGPDSADHSFVDGVGGEPRVVSGPGEYEISNVLINGVRTYARTGGPRQQAGDGQTLEPETDDLEKVGAVGYRLNTVYVMDVDDMRVCHLGELEDVLTTEQVESIGSVNVLMVPVGGTATIGAKRAVEVISQLEPNIVLPMHYRIEGTRSDKLEPVDRFLNEMGAKTVIPQAKLSLNAKASLPADIQITVMENKH